MILNLIAFILSSIVWVAALWLAIRPNLSSWPDGAVMVAHIAPPLAAGMLWIFMRMRAKKRSAAEVQAREASAQVERTAAKEVALKKYEDEMTQRRFGCDCRMVAFSRLGLSPQLASLPIADSGHPNIYICQADHEQEADASNSPLDHFEAAIADALANIYSMCRASITFPVFVLPPSDIPGEDVLAHLRAARAVLADKIAPEIGLGGRYGPVLFLPASDSVVGSFLSLFEAAPDLPGAIVLAFDSPYSLSLCGKDDFESEPDEAQAERERMVGKPSEVVVAMLMTSMHLSSMLTATANNTRAESADSMAPFWERTVHVGGRLESLARVDAELREELAELPVLGRIHRAVVRRLDAGRIGVLELTRTLRDVLDHAQINAGLVELPFVWTEGTESSASMGTERVQGRCGAIVHNAGSVDVAGKRLAALGSALYYFDVDLSPVDNDAVLNIVSGIGDMGRAGSVSQVALACAYSAAKGTPTLCAEFLDKGAIAASFVVPVGAGQEKGLA